MRATRKLWTWLAVICVLSFAVLGWFGTEIYLTAPPIPKQVISTVLLALFAVRLLFGAKRTLPTLVPAARAKGV